MTIGVNYWPKFIISMAGAALAPPQSDRTSRRAHGQRGHLFSDKHPSFCSPLQRLFFLPALFNNILYTIHVACTLSSSPCWKPCTTKKPRSPVVRWGGPSMRPPALWGLPGCSHKLRSGLQVLLPFCCCCFTPADKLENNGGISSSLCSI